MISFFAKVLKNLEPYIPLFQTLVWPIFFASLIIFFRKQLLNCVETLRARVEKSQSFNILGMSCSDPGQYKDKLNQEVEEASQDLKAEGDKESAESGNLQPAIQTAATLSVTKTRYFVLQELALKHLSSLIGRRILREINLPVGGRTIQFDGATYDPVNAEFIEVKIVNDLDRVHSVTRHFCDQVNQLYHGMNDQERSRFSVLFVLIVRSEDEVEHTRDLARVPIAKADFSFRLYVFSENELLKEYGLGC